MYYIGIIICALAIGHEFSQFAGWATLGSGLIFAGLWNAVANSPASGCRIRLTTEEEED